MNWVWFYFKGTEQENESTGLFGKLPSDAIKAEKSNVDKKLEIDKLRTQYHEISLSKNLTPEAQLVEMWVSFP